MVETREETVRELSSAIAIIISITTWLSLSLFSTWKCHLHLFLLLHAPHLTNCSAFHSLRDEIQKYLRHHFPSLLEENGDRVSEGVGIMGKMNKCPAPYISRGGRRRGAEASWGCTECDDDLARDCSSKSCSKTTKLEPSYLQPLVPREQRNLKPERGELGKKLPVCFKQK